MSKFFDELMESVQQMDEIVRGERRPSREFQVGALQVKEIRKATGLTQAKFAALIDV
jgi:putative transcriptional regulator